VYSKQKNTRNRPSKKVVKMLKITLTTDGTFAIISKLIPPLRKNVEEKINFKIIEI